MIKSLRAAALCVATLFASTPALAQDTPRERARQLFNGGVQAFKAKDYKTAARAFDEAFELVQKPALVFSSAQALRREYELTEDAKVARGAIARYEKYLDLVQSGGRRVDARKSMLELKRLVGEGDGLGGSLARETVVQINSATKGAVGSLDGGPIRSLPFSARIDPGQHEVKVYATGHAPRVETFTIEKNEMLMFPVPLEGQAPELDIIGADGARVIIDGVPMGQAPFPRPLELEPGSHLVAVAENGYKPYVEELDFTYGARTDIELDLPMTNQRRAAWGVMGTGAAIFAGGVVVIALAGAKHAEAARINRRLDTGNITAAEAEEYNSLLDERDTLGGLGAGIGALGLLVTGTGLLMYIFDSPEVRPPPSRKKKGPGEKTTPDDESPDVEVFAAPIIAPANYGLTLQGRF